MPPPLSSYQGDLQCPAGLLAARPHAASAASSQTITWVLSSFCAQIVVLILLSVQAAPRSTNVPCVRRTDVAVLVDHRCFSEVPPPTRNPLAVTVCLHDSKPSLHIPLTQEFTARLQFLTVCKAFPWEPVGVCHMVHQKSEPILNRCPESAVPRHNACPMRVNGGSSDFTRCDGSLEPDVVFM